MRACVDLRGREFKMGDKVARGVSTSTSGARVAIAEVTGITDKGFPRLDGSKAAVWYPDWLLIVNEVPNV